ncbi:arabinan endo-1,5-alpha-L-arabinosidase [Actinoplanes campanulatus]|uniref:Arabinan endo-1,5-alpha-L-arabinosidase n=1 Tax=Actinoplanes campanulatus TaxID=113559 RepID=A0A7W5AI78_9ACTN|nr:arabinan endo-1,5-alpha-L-arabinosidase [Actinoplanes campanulatus]MBB3096409.1 arabinan endo-1,5-alpha-L-arabinosidase [Actinoplanes campanulatus]GGN18518.1 arabinan endo-1,5-alpha-L-arabinosidase [Actinoplanes campanulatus]GID38475.1 arabinan endo-1,5-alpha-L-arabinosidase [Actinoplanes campanulatus]
MSPSTTRRAAAIIAALILTTAGGCDTDEPGGTPATAPATPPDPTFLLGDAGVHDPTLVKRPNGGYLLAHTGAGLRLRTSTDRNTFTEAGAVFPGGAPWTTAYTKGSADLWAPDLSYRDGRFWLYYSASTFGSNRSAIFLATSPTGMAGSWTDAGKVIESTSKSDFNAIDPNLYVDDAGNWRLTFGSFWTGIKQIELDPTTGLRRGDTMAGVAERSDTAIEAPYLVKHDDYYYLWVSFDACCKGAASTYRTMVGRSISPDGPFADRNGTPMTAGGGTEILAGHGSVHGPGHPAVLADTDGEYLVYHYYADSGSPHLGINPIGYDAAGWPFVH